MNKNEREVYMANNKKTAQDIVKPIKKTKKKKYIINVFRKR